jgi:hypothetical protein
MFGYNPDYMIEGTILANYVKANFAGQCRAGLRHARASRLGCHGPRQTSTTSPPPTRG